MQNRFTWALAAMLTGCVPIEAPTVATVDAYLDADTARWYNVDGDVDPWGRDAPRFVHRPHVMIVGEASAREVATLGEAIEILNAMLPASRSIQFDPHYRVFNEDHALRTESPAPGSVFIWFLPSEDWYDGPRGALGFARPVRDARERHHIVAGRIMVDTAAIDRADGENLISMILHEFLHLAGRSHPDPRKFPHTIMNYEAPLRPHPYLYPLDIAVFERLYGQEAE